MNPEIIKLGQMFKGRREEMSLSLKEVENATSIRSMYIEAIEQGRISQFISSVYAVGFIKQYANYLGLDAEQIIKQNPRAFNMPTEKHEFSYGIGTLEVRGSMGGGVKWLPNLLWAMATAFVLVGAWYLAKYLELI